MSPAPTPPDWQRELAALGVIRAAAALGSGQAAADGKTPTERLSEEYRRLAAKYPTQAEVQSACGDFLFDSGEKLTAFGYWQRAQELNPRDAALSEVIGEAYLQMGNVQGAEAQFRRAVDAQPGQARFHTDLANVLYLFRHDLVSPPTLPDAESVLVQALEHFRLATQLSPTSRELAQAYAETFYVMAKPDWGQAREAWRKVLELSGENSDFANIQLARASLRLRLPEDAEAYLDRLHQPGFTDVQAKLREQARKMKAGNAAK